jgi:hypothetical protein
VGGLIPGPGAGLVGVVSLQSVVTRRNTSVEPVPGETDSLLQSHWQAKAGKPTAK